MVLVWPFFVAPALLAFGLAYFLVGLWLASYARRKEGSSSTILGLSGAAVVAIYHGGFCVVYLGCLAGFGLMWDNGMLACQGSCASLTAGASGIFAISFILTAQIFAAVASLAVACRRSCKNGTRTTEEVKNVLVMPCFGCRCCFAKDLRVAKVSEHQSHHWKSSIRNDPAALKTYSVSQSQHHQNDFKADSDKRPAAPGAEFVTISLSDD